MESVLGVVGQHLPFWDVAFLAEVDAMGIEHQCNWQSTHLVRRFHPGLGSWAMAFVIHANILHLVRAIVTRGRCMAVHLFQRTADPDKQVSLFILGMHNAHGDAQIDVLSDAAYLIKNRPRGSRVCIIGDTNVDQLPALQ